MGGPRGASRGPRGGGGWGAGGGALRCVERWVGLGGRGEAQLGPDGSRPWPRASGRPEVPHGTPRLRPGAWCRGGYRAPRSRGRGRPGPGRAHFLRRGPGTQPGGGGGGGGGRPPAFPFAGSEHGSRAVCATKAGGAHRPSSPREPGRGSRLGFRENRWWRLKLQGSGFREKRGSDRELQPRPGGHGGSWGAGPGLLPRPARPCWLPGSLLGTGVGTCPGPRSGPSQT